MIKGYNVRCVMINCINFFDRLKKKIYEEEMQITNDNDIIAGCLLD